MADLAITIAEPNLDVLALSDALDKLEKQDRRLPQLVKLRFVAGLTKEAAVEALAISKSVADRDWAYARAWLRVEIEGDARPDASI